MSLKFCTRWLSPDPRASTAFSVDFFFLLPTSKPDERTKMRTDHTTQLLTTLEKFIKDIFQRLVYEKVRKHVQRTSKSSSFCAESDYTLFLDLMAGISVHMEEPSKRLLPNLLTFKNRDNNRFISFTGS